MRLTRRQTLGLMAGAGLVSGCSGLGEKLEAKLPTLETDPDARFLARAGFGARPGEIGSFRKSGRKQWIEEQLDPSDDEPLGLKWKTSRLDINHFSAWELRDWKKEEIISQTQRSDLLYAVESPWQVRERMVDFWTNHFNIYANKSMAAHRIPTDQREVVRKHTLGSFPAMVKASAHSTAMLNYLDQQASQYEHPNENYARELLELHTMGVGSSYTQDDVMEVARCFTGWTEVRGFMKPKGNFHFDKILHDNREKTVLGHKIPAGGGVEDGEKVLEIVTQHPDTAKHLAKKLCRYFLGDDGQQIEGAVADAYMQKPIGYIPNMLRTIFESELMTDGSPTLKRPFDYVVSSLRTLDASTNGKQVLEHLTLMGQPTHLWPMPDGYPIDPEAWSGSVLGRWNFAIELCTGGIEGTSVELTSLAERYNANDREEWVSALFGLSASSNKLTGLRSALKDHTAERPSDDKEWAELTALTLCSPEFQWR